MIHSKAFALLAAVAVTTAACGSEPTTPARQPAATRHTVSATLWGTNQMRPGDSCLWEIFPSGGVPPYTYTYPGGGTGSSSLFYVTYNSVGNYIFRVWVHDSQQNSTYVDQPVSVRSYYPSC